MHKDTLQVYLNRLMDLSSRNRALYLPRLVPSQMIDLHELDYLNHQEAFGFVASLMGKEQEIEVIPLADPRDKQVNTLSQRLKKLSHSVKTAESETGEKSLFVGWPFVEGKLLNDQVVRCPLIFFPVALEKTETHWVWKRSMAEAAFFNKTFWLAYAHAYQKNQDFFGEENPLENFSSDPVTFMNELYDFLKDVLLLDFNSELYENKISPFPNSSKTQDEAALKTGKIRLKPYGVLGQFSQKASFLIQDYRELMAGEDYPDLESMLYKWFSPEKVENHQVREDQLFTVFPVDASQEEVIRSVREGRSCVVEGPPGTGKSQLISNLAMDYIARGKKVLIVSQKRAALDVVFKRLSDEGFGAFLGLVHDFRGDRKALYKKIQDQITSLDHYQELNRGIDAIQIERQFSQSCQQIDFQNDYFSNLKKALFNTEECGVPVKELYLNSKMSDDAFDMNQYYRRFHAGRVNDFLKDFKAYTFWYRIYQSSDSFWLHRVDFSSFEPAVAKRIQEVFDEINLWKNEFESHFLHLDDFDASFLFSFYKQKSKIVEFIKLLKGNERLTLFWKIKDLQATEIDLLWLDHKLDTLKGLLVNEGVEWYSEDLEVEESLQLSIEFLERKKGWRKNFPLLWNRKKFQKVYRLLIENKLESNTNGIRRLIKKLENRMNLNHQYALLKEKSWIELPTKPFDLQEFSQVAAIYKETVAAKAIYHEMGTPLGVVTDDMHSAMGFKNVLQLILGVVNTLDSKIPYWSLYLGKIQVQHLISESTKEAILQVKNQVPLVFDDLVSFDRLKSRLKEHDVQVMEKMLTTYPEAEFEKLNSLFLAGLRLSWIGHIETKYPLLKDVVSQKTLQNQNELMDAVLQKWTLSKYIAEIRLRENTFKKLEYNRLGNVVTYRELSHQVRKQKKIWSIKKLLEDFESEVFRLIPCWLASPETVSALFPLKQSFDLVIFDESSQCYVERGLPAMLRGKQAVIAGDSKQLRPFDLYQIRLETEQEGIDLENESLLELASVYFRKFWLQSHYRSEHLALIHFSNKNFYDNRLKMLTGIELENSDQNPFKLIQVDGVWENQINKEEAYAIIDEIRLIHETHPGYSIGVITFNFFQMEFIRELILEEELGRQEQVSVKNIENVQGDEFDWVIFGIGYAKNKKGKLLANFGMLSKSGGINRLNVAVSRAKKKITLVSSIQAQDFNSEQLKNEGIKMLRDYLIFVTENCEGKEIQIPAPKPYGFESGWSLKNRIEGLHFGLSIEKYPKSSLMDLAVTQKGLYQEAILTDDQRLYNASGSKEAFVYHPLQLKEKGWPYRFYFSRQFWMDQPLMEEDRKSVSNQNSK